MSSEIPLLWSIRSKESGVIRWENWLVFCVRIRTCAVEQESPPTFYFILKERLKKHSKNLLRYFVGSGGRLWKGKVLAPFSSMVIHGLLVTWFLDHLPWFLIAWKWWMCECFWKCFGRRCLVLGYPCNNSLLECFTKVCIFSKRCFKCFWKLFFESVYEVFDSYVCPMMTMFWGLRVGVWTLLSVGLTSWWCFRRGDWFMLQFVFWHHKF